MQESPNPTLLEVATEVLQLVYKAESIFSDISHSCFGPSDSTAEGHIAGPNIHDQLVTASAKLDALCRVMSYASNAIGIKPCCEIVHEDSRHTEAWSQSQANLQSQANQACAALYSRTY